MVQMFSCWNELTVPHSSKYAITEGHEKNLGKMNYCCLPGDFENFVVNSTLITLEVGPLGH